MKSHAAAFVLGAALLLVPGLSHAESNDNCYDHPEDHSNFCYCYRHPKQCDSHWRGQHPDWNHHPNWWHHGADWDQGHHHDWDHRDWEHHDWDGNWDYHKNEHHHDWDHENHQAYKEGHPNNGALEHLQNPQTQGHPQNTGEQHNGPPANMGGNGHPQENDGNHPHQH
jgi:hypothetical protein